ncbi:MAG: response regulator [Gemmatimonadetes bacterium]|nr:response regulator [Gemmatimonadota bacterium]
MTAATRTVPLRALVVDDDPVSRALLTRYVGQHDALQLVEVCASAVEAVPFLRAGDVDVVFLDVEMPEMSGLELVRALDRRPHVVLVTGKAQYAVEAFAVAVSDYLLSRCSSPLPAGGRARDACPAGRSPPRRAAHTPLRRRGRPRRRRQRRRGRATSSSRGSTGG